MTGRSQSDFIITVVSKRHAQKCSFASIQWQNVAKNCVVIFSNGKDQVVVDALLMATVNGPSKFTSAFSHNWLRFAFTPFFKYTTFSRQRMSSLLTWTKYTPERQHPPSGISPNDCRSSTTQRNLLHQQEGKGRGGRCETGGGGVDGRESSVGTARGVGRGIESSFTNHFYHSMETGPSLLFLEETDESEFHRWRHHFLGARTKKAVHLYGLKIYGTANINAFIPTSKKFGERAVLPPVASNFHERGPSRGWSILAPETDVCCNSSPCLSTACRSE